MKKKIIHFLSASDRLNFGDLLFPIIFKRLLNKNEYDFKNYGLVKSDLSYFGALKTNSYKTLLKNLKKEKGNLIVGGGEVLFPDWYTLISYIYPNISKILSYRIFFQIEKRLNLFKKNISGSDNLYPFTINENPDFKVIYNSVGGEFRNYISEKNKEKLTKSLNNADYVSVRDARSEKSLKSRNIPVSLVPDSAIIVSDIISLQEVSNKISIDKNSISSNYFVLQMGLGKTPKDKLGFTKKLIDLAKKNDLKIIACPIGLAHGHEDHKVLAEFKAICPQIKLVMPGNLYDIIYLISNAKFYMGTSLHGLITAQSYKTPYFPLNKEINKLSAYTNTWVSEIVEDCIDFDHITKVNEIYRNWDYEKAEELLNFQKKLVYKNFEKILKIINT